MDGPKKKKKKERKKNWKSCTETLKMLKTFNVFKEIFV